MSRPPGLQRRIHLARPGPPPLSPPPQPRCSCRPLHDRNNKPDGFSAASAPDRQGAPGSGAGRQLLMSQWAGFFSCFFFFSFFTLGFLALSEAPSCFLQPAACFCGSGTVGGAGTQGQGQGEGEEAAGLAAELDLPHPGSAPDPGPSPGAAGERVQGEGRPLTFPSASESLELLLLLLESEELLAPCWGWGGG